MLSCKNIGSVDRTFRGLVGISALVAAFTVLGAQDKNALGIVAAVVGVVMLLTATIRMCPLYIPLGISTCRNG